MTEPKPPEQYEPALREAEIRAAITARFVEAGWEAVSFSVPGPVPRQWKAWPDLFYCKDGHVLLVEGKVPGKRLTDDQQAFFDRVLPHTGSHFRLLVLCDAAECDGWLVPGEGKWDR